MSDFAHRQPVLIGAGQITQREADPRQALSPLGLMAAAARRAFESARLGSAALGSVDQVAVVDCMSWRVPNAPRALAAELGLHPAQEVQSSVGGNSPQRLVNEAARAIVEGRVRLALLAGAEAMRTRARARRAGLDLGWPGQTDVPAAPLSGDPRPGSTPQEIAHGLFLPVQVYPLLENAIRARRGETIVAHRERLADLCASFSRVAAGHEHAWFREARDARRIATIDADNRMIGFPYPNLMNAIMEVDQGAAVLVTSLATARELGVSDDDCVHLLAGADAHDEWFVCERAALDRSPAIAEIGRAVLEASGVGLDAIELIDLYSCFPSVVQMAREALGLAEDDTRPHTVTGGLAAFGGAGNNYSMHAIATVFERLRAGDAAFGLVTALGWYATKHSIGIYGREPGGAYAPADDATVQARVDAVPPALVAADGAGAATVETYSVMHDRTGAPERGVAFCRLADGQRVIATIEGGPAVLASFEESEGVGRRGEVRRKGELGAFV